MRGKQFLISCSPAPRDHKMRDRVRRVDGRVNMAYIANVAEETEMATRNVVLTEPQSQMIDELVASGRFQNASEALRAGLRLLEREEAELRDLRLRLARGVQQARDGDLAQGSGEDAIRRAFGGPVGSA